MLYQNGLEINMKLKASMLRTHTSLMVGLIIWVGSRMLFLVDNKTQSQLIPKVIDTYI